MAFENLSNEQLVNVVINTAHRVSILSESNDLIDLREELMSRLTKRALDVCNECGAKIVSHQIGQQAVCSNRNCPTRQ